MPAGTEGEREASAGNAGEKGKAATGAAEEGETTGLPRSCHAEPMVETQRGKPPISSDPQLRTWNIW